MIISNNKNKVRAKGGDGMNWKNNANIVDSSNLETGVILPKHIGFSALITRAIAARNGSRNVSSADYNENRGDSNSTPVS